MPKTGGTWITNVIQANAPEEWGVQLSLPAHRPATVLAPSVFRFGFVRNPWDWYVSLFHFVDERFRDGRDLKSMAVKKWHQALLGIPRGRAGFEAALRFSVEHDSLQTRHEMTLCDSHGALLCEVGRFENIRGELERLLVKATGSPLPRKLANAIKRSPKMHSSTHDHYRTYYTDEMRELVSKADASYIRQFGYSF